MDVQSIGVISQKRLKIEVKLLLSANRKSDMPRRLAQQRMTLSDLEWLFRSSSVPSVWEGVHCDQTVHFSADSSLWLDSPMFWATLTPKHIHLLTAVFFQFRLEKRYS